jgi:hypothetical protein
VISSSVSIRWQSASSGLRQHHHWFTVTSDAFVLSDSLPSTSTGWSSSFDSYSNSRSTALLIAILLPIIGIVCLVLAITAYCCLRRKADCPARRAELSDVLTTEPTGPVVVDASTAFSVAPPSPNAPPYAPCQMAGYPWPAGPYPPAVAAPVGLPQGAPYQSSMPVPAGLQPGAKYQGPVGVYPPPQLVPVAGGYGPVYFPAPGYPYHGGGVFPGPPSQQPQQPHYFPPSSSDGPQ